LIYEQEQKTVEITQDDMDASVVVMVEVKGKELNVKNPAAVAESTMAVNDAMNSDYFFRGEIKDNVIVFKPDVSVLRSWPRWAKPPSRSDLEACVVTLERL
jgi:hypothetical protein